jgi:Ca2+-binding RTX toxin-like protein
MLTIFTNKWMRMMMAIANSSSDRNLSRLSIVLTAAAIIVAAVPSTLIIAYAATINGTDGDDTLEGTAKSDTIYGYGGNDYIYGFDGNDILYGGRGNDRVYGNEGDDSIYGWRGDNRLYGSYGNDVIYATGDWESPTDTNFINAGSGNDFVQLKASRGTIYGFGGVDRIHAGAEYEEPITIYAGNNNDRIFITGSVLAYGEAGNDYFSSSDATVVRGGDGNDYIEAGSGLDLPHWYGGPGSDTFNCHGSEDVNVEDYSRAEGNALVDCPSGTLS